MIKLPALLALLALSLALLGCDRIPEEGTIVYDIDFPRADSDEAQGGGGGSSNGSTPSGLSTSASVEVVTINEGATDTETFVLSGPPNGTVTITFSSGDTSEATLSPASMSFDNSTWNIPQTLTITAPEDYSVDGNQTTTISYTIASTNPTDTLHGAAGNFNVVTADSGNRAVSIANSSPSLTEGTTNNSTTFQLSGPPNGTVTVTITSSDTGEATVSPSTMTFDNTTWNVAQPITLSGVEDYLIDGNQSSTISYTLSSTDTTEPFHNAFGSFSASIVDSGTRLFVVSDDSPSVNEGYSSTITFALDSAPNGTVTVNLSSADDNETTVSPTTLTFNSGNYNAAQTITLYGPEDYIIDGNQQTVVNFAVTSTDPTDVVHNVNTSITVTTVDSGLGTAFSLSTATPAVTEGTTDNSTTFVLLSPPKGTVTVTFSSADDNETVVSPNTLTFTPANWNVPQALPLVGVEDFIADGNQTTAMNVSFSSTDSTDGVHGETGSFNVITNDSGITGTFTLSPSTPGVGEGSSDNSSTFVLTSAPNGTVTVTLSSDNSSELGVSPTNLVFTPANWNVPQNFTVTGVEDFNVDGTQSTNINISYSSSDTTDGIHGQSSSFAVNVTDSGTGATTITSAVAGEQKVTLNWSGPAGMSSYTIYYTSDGSTPTTSSDNITITDGTATSYVLGGLTGGLNYNFSLVTTLGPDSSNLVGPVAATPSVLSCSPSYTPDTDSDLLVYYDFDDSSGEGLHDKSPANGRTASASAWPYDLTNTGGTLRFPQGCTHGMAGYFDSSSGYVENNNLNDTSTGNRFVNGNFTITMWFYAESDMVNHSGLMASKQVAGTGNDGGNWSWQLESTGSANLRWRSSHGANTTNASRYTHTETSSTYSKNQWTHAAFVKNDNGTSQIYLNGVLEATSSETQNTPMNKLFIGVNRALANSWKGYIDEVKVFGRTFTADNVTDACLLYQECEKHVAPKAPTGLAATGGSRQVALTWNAATGASNYTVYYSTDNSSFNAISPVVTGTSYTHTGLSVSTTYYYYIKANNTAGASGESNRASATTSAAPGISLSATTATVRESGVRGDMLWSNPIGDGIVSTYLIMSVSTIDSEMNVISGGITRKPTVITNLGGGDWLLMKHSPSGELIWQKQIGSNTVEHISDVAVDSDDNIYVFGGTLVGNGGTFDGVTVSKAGTSEYVWILAKFDKDGNRQWLKSIDKSGTNSFFSYPHAMDVEGSAIYIAGYSNVDLTNQVEKYDLNGNKQATINITPPTNSAFTASSRPYIEGFDATSNGVYLTSWIREGGGSAVAGKLTKLDNNLSSEVWQVQIDDHSVFQLKVLPNGNIVVRTTLYGSDTSNPQSQPVNIYSPSGSLVSSADYRTSVTARQHATGNQFGEIAVDSANNMFFIQEDFFFDRRQQYIVKYDSSGNFVYEKKLPPNFVVRSLSLRQNSAGEEFIYVNGRGWQSHQHSQGQVAFNWGSSFVGRLSNNSVAPVSSTPGYASIKFEVATTSTHTVYVCPRYNNAYITTGVVSDELVVHPAGPTTDENADYYNSCLNLRNFNNGDRQTHKLEFYALQDNVTDADQVIPITFRVISGDSTYNGMSLPTVNVTVENAAVSAPTAPVNLKATANGATNLITWQKPYLTGLGEGVQNYTLQWNTDNGSSWTNITGITSDNYTHSGLSSSTNYFYQVFANNQGGAGPVSNRDNITTGTLPSISLSSTAISITESGRRGDADWWIQEGTATDEKTGGTNFAHNAIDSEMNIIGFGSTYGSYVGSNQGYTDLIVAKFDPSGKRLWNKQIGTNNFDYAHYGGVAVDSNDNIYLYGTRRNASGQPTGGFRRLIKLDKNGTTQWDKYLDSSPSTSYAESTDIIIEGNYIYLTGKDPDRKVEIHKYDFDGNQVASKEITSSFTAISLMASGFTASSSAVYVTVWGNTGGAIASDLIKLPLDLSSQTLLNNATDMQFNEMGLLSNGNVVIVGRDPNSDPYGTPIMRTFNSSGTQLSSGTKNQGNSNRQMNSGYYDDKLVIDSADNIIFLQINSLANNNKESYLVKYDSSGNFINEKKLPKYNGLPTGLDIRKNPEGTDEIISVSATISPNGVYGIDGLYYMYTGGIARYSNNAAPVTSTPGYTEVNFSVDSKPSSHVYVCPSYSSSELVVLPNGDRSFSYLTGYNIYGAYNCIKIFHDPGSKYSTAPIKFFAVQDNVTDGNKDVTVGFTVHSMDLNYNGLTIDNVTVTVIDAAVPSPNAPLHLKATLDNSTGTSNVLSWYKPNTNLGEGIQNYTLRWNTDNGTSWTTVTGITGTTYTHTGVTAGTTYYYEVFANNQGGAGAVSNRVNAAVPGVDWWCCGNQSPSSPAIGSPNPVVSFPDTRAKAVSIPEGVTVLFNTKLDAEPIGGTVVYDIAASSSRISSNLSQLIFTESMDLSTRWDNYAPSNRQWRITINDDSIDQSDVNDEVYLTLTINGATTDSRYNTYSPIQVWFDPVDDDTSTPAAPVLNSVTAGVQQNTIAWNAYSGATGYKLYWDTSASVSTSDNLITISDNSSTSYIHSGRTAGTQYYYRLIATTSGGDSTLSNELSDTPTALSGCTSSGAVADNDPDLLVHYAFEGNLEDIEDTNSDNRYDLTNEEGTMQFAQGCAQGQAAYIDSSSGYGVNTQFTSTNVGGNLANDNFTVSLWLAKDGDMAGFSSAFNTGFYDEHSPTGFQEKAQIDIDDGSSGRLRMISNSPSNGRKVRSGFSPNMDQWYHVTAVHSPPSTVRLYTDGTLQATNNTMNIDFYGLVVGLNRSRTLGELNWKGYIDEVKVFNRSFSADDVADDCMKSDKCPYVPATAPTLTGTGRAQAIYLTWNLPGGTDNATIYWRTSGGASEGSPTAPTASDNVINTSDNQTSYLLTGLTGGHYYHFVIKANNKNGSSPVSSVLGNVQPTSFVANTFDTNNGGVCKIQNDKSLHCKGRNNLDQYDNARTARPGAVDVFGITNAETISHDYNKVSVIKSDGSYQHRGYDDSRGSLTSPVTGVSNPIQVEQGYDFVAYLMSNGTIRTRGDNTYGQLGNGSNTNETSGSVQVSGITTAVKIVTGQWHMCALLSNAQVWCWGVNSFGELGDGTTTHRNAPVQASLPSNTAVDIFVGGRTSAAVLSNGKVYTWGSNTNSKAKCSTNTNNISTPRELTVISDVKEIDFGTGHSVILKNNGDVYTCGTNYLTSNVAGNAAFLTAQGSDAAKKTNGAILMDDYNGRVAEVRADGNNSYMLLDNGSLACIGDNEYGQCNSDGSTMGTDQLTPIIMPDM